MATLLSAGTQLGPYEILAPLGSGGMGEVYRARDTRLDREVAVKVLLDRFATDTDALARFKREAKAVASLSHPNILAIHDFRTVDEVLFAVTELLDGESLGSRLKEGPLPWRKAAEIGAAIANGLAAAHSKGIVHRDLKPDNVFITSDNQVKILDFGLARIDRATPRQDGSATLQPDATKAGTLMGTVGYMAPEQVRGERADARADIFSLGCILYEMIAGEGPFRRETAAETMAAILRDDSPELIAAGRKIPAELERLIRHCLEKQPSARFQSAQDLVFDLETLSAATGMRMPSTVVAAARSKLRSPALLWGALLVAVVAVLGFALGVMGGKAPPPSYQRLTYRHGFVSAARFAPDGHAIVYSASWGVRPMEVFSTRSESPESSPISIPSACLLSVSPSGELAVLLSPGREEGWSYTGTLARVPLAGGAPREILEDVNEADWTPDGQALAVVHRVAGRSRLALFPGDEVLHETAGYISHARVSPAGDRVAFLDHPVLGDDRGRVMVSDLEGNTTVLTDEWNSEQGLAWTTDGDEIWFTATRVGGARTLYAVSLSGRTRVVTRAPVSLTLQDISADGQVLVTCDRQSGSISGLFRGESAERDLSWFDQSPAQALSRDGRTLLLSTFGEGGGEDYSVYLLKTDGSPAVRLGDGMAAALSPDGDWALSILRSSQLVLLPTGPGQSRVLERGGVEYYRYASWSADGTRIVFTGNAPGHGLRTWVQEVEGGDPRPITPEGAAGTLLSTDGRFVAATGPDGRVSRYPVDGGEPIPLEGLEEGMVPIQWSEDGNSVYVYRPGRLPARIHRLSIATGRMELVKEIMPGDPAGVVGIFPVLMTRDGESYVYNPFRVLSDLHLVNGLE